MSHSRETTSRQYNGKVIVGMLVVCCVIVAVGILSHWIHKIREDVYALGASWQNDALHVYSAKDGPFVVTHLYQPRSDSRGSSVAQLPEPVTIIDSSGHYFTLTEIRALKWVGASGGKASPPSPGTEVKAFYWVPKETESTSNY